MCWFVVYLGRDLLSDSCILLVILQGAHSVLMVYVAVVSGVTWMAAGVLRVVAVFMIYDAALLLLLSCVNQAEMLSVLSLFVWMLIVVLDCGRTPFDLAECESELVSGYTTEYGASMFALFASMEYGLMLWSVVLLSVVNGAGVCSCLWLLLFFILLRGLLPRLFVKDL